MKKTPLISMAFLLLVIASCSNKNDGQIACTAQYVLPSLNFDIINKSDFTMPVYITTDINIYLKNGLNKIDTISPVLKSTPGQKYFSLTVRSTKQIDTCYIQIKNLKTDTLIYSITNSNAPCPQPYISSVAINKASPLIIAPDAIIQIKK